MVPGNGFQNHLKAGYVKRILPVCNAGLLLSSQTTNQEPTIRTVGLPELEMRIKINQGNRLDFNFRMAPEIPGGNQCIFFSFLADMANRVPSLPFKSYNVLKTSLITQAKSVARAYTSSPGGRGQCTH